MFLRHGPFYLFTAKGEIPHRRGKKEGPTCRVIWLANERKERKKSRYSIPTFCESTHVFSKLSINLCVNFSSNLRSILAPVYLFHPRCDLELHEEFFETKARRVVELWRDRANVKLNSLFPLVIYVHGWQFLRRTTALLYYVKSIVQFVISSFLFLHIFFHFSSTIRAES